MKGISAAMLALLLAITSDLQAQQQRDPSDRLFGNASLSTLIDRSSEVARRHPHDVNARFVQMESARLALDDRRELSSALALLESTTSSDPRGELAAERVLELAANTPVFRAAVPRIGRLLRLPNPYSLLLSDALLTARADGVRLPSAVALTRPISRWQIAGPFGKYSNVDFERPWPAEQDQLLSPQLGDRHREEIEVQNGRLDLPDYLFRSGVYYAATDVRTHRAGKYSLTIESEGTFQLSVDKRPAVTHDVRFHQLASTLHVELDLSAGRHRVLLKLHPSALPIRLWIEEPLQKQPTVAQIPPAVLAYVTRATSLIEGSAAADSSSATLSRNVLLQFLNAEELLQNGEVEAAKEVLTAMVDSDPRALRSHLELAQQAFSEDHFEDAAKHLHVLLQHSRSNWRVQELRYQVAAHFGWPEEEQDALSRRLALHPSCSAWQDANQFYSAQEEFEKAHNALDHLANCSDAPYLYWSQLGERGEHEKALSHIAEYLRTHPLDRRALTASIREAVLAGRETRARHYAELMTRVAPNFAGAKQLETAPDSILDSRSAALRTKPSDFWIAYNRDPLPRMSSHSDEAADTHLLINDKVIDFGPQGDAWVYRHTVVQVFDKYGMENEGEVAIPRSAQLLTLQTVKANGARIQPELADSKTTVSMPSLELGDAVELSYLQHFSPDAIENSPHELDFSYGAADSPTQTAQLTLIRERGHEPVFLNSAAARLTRDSNNGSKHITTWEISKLPALTQEPAAPEFDGRPVFRFLATDRLQQRDGAARLRDKLITATRITPLIQRTANGFDETNPSQRIAAAYESVTSSIANNDESWQTGSVSSADESFQNGEGNRAVALIALLSAMGFDADLQLAAERGTYNPAEDCETQNCFRYPIVRVTLADHSRRLLDPQTDGIAAGALPPQVEGQPAMIISRTHAVVAQLAMVPVTTDQKSVATADLQLDSEGKIRGSLHIRFGSLRGAQVRTALRSMSAHDRQMYFEQIAGRILPNPHGVSASLSNETNTSQPLQLELKVSSATVGHLNGSDLEIGQVIPALGLSRLYASLPQRRQDLFLETPLVENSEFLVHLPSGVEPVHMPGSVNLHTEFGDYRTEFRAEKLNEIKIVRNFRMPVQIVSPAKYQDFAKFALQIDSAERQLITIQQTATVASGTAH